MDYDKQILELALREVALALNDLVSDCLSNDGHQKAPSRQSVMKAKAALPNYCSQSFKKAKRDD